MINFIKKIKTFFTEGRWVYSISLVVVAVGLIFVSLNVRSILQNINTSVFVRFNSLAESRSELVNSSLAFKESQSVSLSFLANVEEVLLGHQESYPLAQVNLQKFADITKASSAFILDTSGNCILSSDESFIGENYAFREYFIEAIDGENGFYPAIGVTSNVLGLYFSSPIVVEGKIIGVAVFKDSGNDISDLLKSFSLSTEDFVALETITGVSFLSNGEEKTLSARKSLSQKDYSYLQSNKQFPLEALSIWDYSSTEYVAGGEASYYEDSEGEIYIFSEKSLPSYDLNLIWMVPYKTITESENILKGHVHEISIIAVLVLLAFIYLFFLFSRRNRNQFLIKKELSETKKALNEVVEKLPIGIVRTTLNGKMTYVNKSGLEILGIKSLSDAKKRYITDFYLNIDDRKNLVKDLKKSRVTHLERLEFYNADRSRVLFLRIHFWLDDLGRNIEAVFEDVTKGVIASDRLQSASLSASEVIWETDNRGLFTYCSSNFEEVLGYKSEDVLGKAFYDFMQGDDAVRAKKHFDKSLKKKEDIRGLINEYLHKEGRVVVLELNANAYYDSKNSIIGFRGSAKNLTQLLSQQKDLQLLSNAVEQSANTIVITDIDGNIQYVNPYFEKLTGYSKEDVIGKNPRILNSGYQDKIFFKELWDTILSGKVWKGLVRNKRKDGSLFWEESTITPISNENGDIINFIAIKENVTRNRELEEETALYNLITKNIGDELYLINEEEGFEFINDTSARSLKMSVKELKSLTMKDIDRDYISNIWREKIESLKSSSQTEVLEVAFLTKDDVLSIKELTLRYLIYKDKDYLLAIGRDITQRKTKEEIEKDRTEELEKLNQLTTGREYKIVELQDKVEDLETKLTKFKKYFGKR